MNFSDVSFFTPISFYAIFLELFIVIFSLSFLLYDAQNAFYNNSLNARENFKIFT